MNSEHHFNKFRKNIVGIDQSFLTPYGSMKMVYADWIASGRLYEPIENKISGSIGPYIGNTHTETSETGRLMTEAYREAHRRIKSHVNGSSGDVLLTPGFGMTGAVVKFQRILGLKTCGMLTSQKCLDSEERPIVFITHMEHHSNHTTWYETAADIVIVEPGADLCVDLNHLEDALKRFKNRKRKIGSFSACSNVTGIRTPYHQMAKLMHEYGGVAFVDFAASAPYDDMDMHPADPMEKLDAIFFSPHKFLGGPGSSGVLIFDSSLYNNKVPDHPGGGTVEWTNRWGEYKFTDNIEVREDGGTPGFLQAIKTALSIGLKDQMQVEMIHRREEELNRKAFSELRKIPGLHLLAENVEDRLGVISFYIDSIHYNLIVRLLSDRFGIQVRGGCACAGTYGHYLLNVSYDKSRRITDKINHGDLSEKPGWVRLSLHPTMTDAELIYTCEAIRLIQQNHKNWGTEYHYDKFSNEFRYNGNRRIESISGSFFDL
jgi:selenocysteine lyase/cysteine desulfurase